MKLFSPKNKDKRTVTDKNPRSWRRRIPPAVGLIILLGLLPLTWFRGQNLISGGDFGMPLDWGKYRRVMGCTWDETISLGSPDFRQVALLIPYGLLGAGLESVGFSLVAIEKIFFVVWFAGAGLSFYYLTGVLGMRRLGRLAAALFYMFNPFSLVIIWRVSHGLIQMPYAFAPLVLGLYLGGLKGQKGARYLILANLLWLLATASAYANPRMIVVHWLPMAVYFVWELVLSKDRRKRLALGRYTASFLVYWLLINAYWLVPSLAAWRQSVASAHSPFLLPDLEQLKLTSVRLVEAVRMLGYWSLNSGFKGDPYYPYWSYYQRPVIVGISWLIPILVVGGLLNSRVKGKKIGYFLASLLIGGLIGIGGAYPPLGGLLLALYRRLPLLALLTRFNFLFYGLPTYLALTVLVGYGFITFYDHGLKRLGRLVWAPLSGLIILLCVVLVFPFWNGEVIKAEGDLFPGERTAVPDYWWEVKDWLTDQKEFFRILPLPMSKTYNVAFNWGEGYSGGDPTRWLAEQPVLNANTGESFTIPMLVGESLERGSQSGSLAKLLGFLNVRYLLVRGDSRWEFPRGQGWWFNHHLENIGRFVGSQEGLSLEKKIGPLEFYRLDDRYLLPRLYAPEKLTLIDGEVDSLEDTAQFLQPEDREAFALLGSDESRQSDAKEDLIWRQPATPEVDGQSDYQRVVFSVKISNGGRYEIMLRDNGFLDFYSPGVKSLFIELDQEGQERRGIRAAGDNLISLGEMELTPGEHTLTVFPPEPLNLAANPSFESDQLGDLPIERSSDARVGSYSLQLTAETHPELVSLPVEDYRVGETYRLALAAKHLIGTPPLVVIWENYGDSTTPLFNPTPQQFGLTEPPTKYSAIELPMTPSWEEYEYTFKPSPEAVNIGLSLGVGFQPRGESSSLFDDIKVERVFTNPLILRRLGEEAGLTFNPPQVDFHPISPVKYLVNVRGAQEPYLLVFSEAFHPGWTLTTEAEHLTVNGFANGWMIDQPGDYQLTIFFKPQRVYRLGVGISLLTLVISLTYLFIGRRVWPSWG